MKCCLGFRYNDCDNLPTRLCTIGLGQAFWITEYREETGMAVLSFESGEASRVESENAPKGAVVGN